MVVGSVPTQKNVFGSMQNPGPRLPNRHERYLPVNFVPHLQILTRSHFQMWTRQIETVLLSGNISFIVW